MKANIIRILSLTFITCFFFPGKCFCQNDTSGLFKRTPVINIVGPAEEITNQRPSLYIQVTRFHSGHLLSITVQSGKGISFTVDKTKGTVIRYGQDNAIVLHQENFINSAFGGMGFGQYVVLDFNLSDDQYTALKVYNVSAVEVAYSEGYFNFSLDDKQSEIFKSTINAIN